MPNAYASVSEIRGALEALRPQTTKYDAQLLRLAGQVSRMVDQWTHRVFFPTLETRIFEGEGGDDLWIPDLVSATTVEYSYDWGQTYTALTTSDYIGTVSEDRNAPQSWNCLELSLLGRLPCWPEGEGAVRITGIWASSDNRSGCWEATGDTVQDNPLTSGAASLNVTDVDGLDSWGAPRFQPGALYKIDSEFVEAGLAIDTTLNTVAIVRGRNGTTAAAHLQNAAIYVWRVPEAVRQAVIVECVRAFQRANQGFGDGRGGVDGAEIFYQRQLDPSTVALLAPYRIPTVG